MKNFHKLACSWQENRCEQMRRKDGWPCCCMADNCPHLTPNGCELKERKRAKLCNLYLCESALENIQEVIGKREEGREKAELQKSFEQYVKTIQRGRNKEKIRKIIQKHEHFIKK